MLRYIPPARKFRRHFPEAADALTPGADAYAADALDRVSLPSTECGGTGRPAGSTAGRVTLDTSVSNQRLPLRHIAHLWNGREPDPPPVESPVFAATGRPEALRIAFPVLSALPYQADPALPRRAPPSHGSGRRPPHRKRDRVSAGAPAFEADPRSR
ncbi:hypothetical protein D3C73_1214260 [compost metagenome]